jgi:hypothetical protein
MLWSIGCCEFDLNPFIVAYLLYLTPILSSIVASDILRLVVPTSHVFQNLNEETTDGTLLKEKTRSSVS